jgi:hypothetical protein
MQAFISSCIIGLVLTLGSPIMSLAEESVPESAPAAVLETDPSSSEDQGVQSSGFFSKLPAPPKAPKIRSLSTSEKNLAKAVFSKHHQLRHGENHRYAGSRGKTVDHQHAAHVYE